jgi:transposase
VQLALLEPLHQDQIALLHAIRWQALTRYIDDGELPADNNWVENQIRPIATGRKNWLFAGSLRSGQRVAAVMSLAHSARLNGHDPI